VRGKLNGHGLGQLDYRSFRRAVVCTVLTLILLRALYSIWFGVRPTAVPSDETQAVLVSA